MSYIKKKNPNRSFTPFIGKNILLDVLDKCLS